MTEDEKYYQTQEFKALLEQYEQMVADGRQIYMDADDLCDIAEYYNQQDAPVEQVQAVVDYALQLHPDCSTALALDARLAMDRGDLEQAMLITDSIPDQNDREVYYIRAELLMCQGRADDAFSYLYDLRDTVAEELDYYLYESGHLFMDYSDVVHAAIFAQELQAYAPLWYNTWDLSATVLLASEHYADALPFIENMLDADTFDCDLWCMAAEAYSGAQQYDKALEATENALAIEPENYRAKQLHACGLFFSDRVSEALKLFQELIADFGGSDQDYLFLSYCLYDQGQYEESLKAVLQALEIAESKEPDQLTVSARRALYEQHAIAASTLGRIDEALNAIDVIDKNEMSVPGQWPPDMLRARVYAENELPDIAMNLIISMTHGNDKPSKDSMLMGAQLMYDFGYNKDVMLLLAAVGIDTLEPEQKGIAYGMQAGCLHRAKEYELAWRAIGEAYKNGTTEIASFLDGFLPYDTPDADAQDFYYLLVGGNWAEESK